MTSESNNTGVSKSSQVASPTVVAQAPMVHTFKLVSVPLGEKLKGEKLEKFNGFNFKRWQQTMLFYLRTFNLARFLTEDASKLKEDERNI